MNKNMKKTQDEIIKEFSNINDWYDKYKYIIKQGKNLEPVDEIIKSEEYSISNCQSQVWLNAEINNKKIHYYANSDSLIVKGILSLLLRVLNDNKPEDIINADLYFIEKTGLKSSLSPSRANGLMSIIEHIKTYAEKATNS